MSLPTAVSEDDARVVEEALASRPEWYELSRVLHSAGEARGSEPLRMLSLAFVYDLVPPNQDDRRATAGSPYASMVESEAGAFPPRPGDVVDEVLAVWQSADEAIDDPIVQARIGDLLYVARGKQAHDHGRSGAAALVELAQSREWPALDRAECMARAIEILAELNDRTALADAVEIARELGDELLEQEHPGPPFIVLRTLTRLKADQRPRGLEQLLDRTEGRFNAGHAGQAALAIAADATDDPERRLVLRRRQLDLRIREADEAEGLTKVHFLQRAHEFARRYGFTHEASELLKQQQDLPEEELGLQAIDTGVEIPREVIEGEIDRVVGSHAVDAIDALRRLGSLPPPGGSNEDLDREVEQQDRDYPLARLFPQQLFGPHVSVPLFIAASDESKRLLARARQRKLHADFYGALLIAPMLDEIKARHHQPTRDALAKHFSTELIGDERGERFARAVELFWEEQYDEAAHVLAPRLESVLRELARAVGITIVKPAEEGKFGGVIALGSVMSKLRGLLADAAWHDYIEALLCDPLAMNLRNDIAHGLAGRVGPVNAGLLIQAACYLALVRKSG